MSTSQRPPALHSHISRTPTETVKINCLTPKNLRIEGLKNPQSITESTKIAGKPTEIQCLIILMTKQRYL